MRVIQSNSKLPLWANVDVFNSNRTSKYLGRDFAEWKIELNSPRGLFILVGIISKLFANFFHCRQIPKTAKLLTGKIQLNAELTF